MVLTTTEYIIRDVSCIIRQNQLRKYIKCVKNMINDDYLFQNNSIV